MIRGITLIILCLILSASCRGRKTNDEVRGLPESVITPSHFTIENHNGYRKLIIRNPWQENARNDYCYYMYPRNAEVPDTIPETSVIRVPVKRMVCMSTTHIAMLRAIGAENVIVGISGADLIYDQGIRDAIRTGAIKDVGYEQSLDKELIVSLQPDLIMAYGIEAASAEYLRKLREMGVASMYNADYLEKHPLARCEWIRVFGALTGRERIADSLYLAVATRYLTLLDSIYNFPKSYPDVLLGYPWEDVWYIPPEDSYVVKLVTDAGGNYLFSDVDAPYAVPYSVEAVFERALKADYWLNPGYAAEFSDIENSDYRMAQLPVFKSQNVYNNNNRSVEGGGNDYWEGAIMHPDVVLRDMASILHPGFIPDYKPVYYRKLK